MNNFPGSKSYHSRLPDESILDDDADSDRAILEDEENKSSGIMKTTQVVVSEEIGASSSQVSDGSPKRSHGWPGPNATSKGQHAI
jgi:hypothetical protein